MNLQRRIRISHILALFALLSAASIAKAEHFDIVIGLNGTTPSKFVYSVQLGMCFAPTPLPSILVPEFGSSVPTVRRYTANGSSGDDYIVVVNNAPQQFCGQTVQPLGLASNQSLHVLAGDGNDIVWGGERKYSGPAGLELGLGGEARLFIAGGPGNDLIYGGTAVQVFGDAGDDHIIGVTQLGSYGGGAGDCVICTQIDGVFTIVAFDVSSSGGTGVFYGANPIFLLPPLTAQFDTQIRDRCSLGYFFAAVARNAVHSR